jgi:hypothetical protein
MSLIPYAGSPALNAAKADDLTIPDYLKRSPDDPPSAIKAPAKPAEATTTKALQDEAKTAKSRGRIAKMKAKQNGELAKMPLTGKAALEAINAADPKPGKLPVPPPSAKQDRAKAKDKPKPAPKDKPAGQRKPPAAKKAAKAPKAPKSANRTSEPRSGSKTAMAADLIRRSGGCTTADILKATGWPAVSVPAIARASGIKLAKEKDGSVTRYRAE